MRSLPSTLLCQSAPSRTDMYVIRCPSNENVSPSYSRIRSPESGSKAQAEFLKAISALGGIAGVSESQTPPSLALQISYGGTPLTG